MLGNPFLYQWKIDLQERDYAKLVTAGSGIVLADIGFPDNLHYYVPEMLQDAIDSSPQLNWMVAVANGDQIGVKGQNCWAGLKATTQQQIDQFSHSLLSIPRTRQLYKGNWLYLDGLSEPVDLISYLGDKSIWCDCAPGTTKITNSSTCSVCRRTVEVGDTYSWVYLRGQDKPLHPDWVRSIGDQCLKTRTPLWFAGYGKWFPIYLESNDRKVKVHYHILDSQTPIAIEIAGLGYLDKLWWADGEQDKLIFALVDHNHKMLSRGQHYKQLPEGLLGSPVKIERD